MTPWTPVPPEANHPSRRPRVPAIVNRACRGAVTAPAPRSAGHSPKTIAVPASPQSPTVLAWGPCRLPRPVPPGRSRKTNAVPASRRSSTVSAGPQSSLPWAFNSRTCVFSHYSTAFHGQNPTAVGVCPKHRIFLKMSKKPLLPCRGFLLPVSLLKFCFSFVFGSVNAQTLCLFVHQAQNYIRTYTVEPA